MPQDSLAQTLGGNRYHVMGTVKGNQTSSKMGQTETATATEEISLEKVDTDSHVAKRFLDLQTPQPAHPRNPPPTNYPDLTHSSCQT